MSHRIRLRYCMLSMLSAYALSFSVAGAQLVVPGAADAARIRQSTQMPVPEFSDVQKPPAATMPPVNVLPYNDNAPEFILKSVRVTGSTLLTKKQVRDLFFPYELKTITTNTINDLAYVLSRYYYDHGYVFSRVILPDQEIVGGVVTLKVIEGYVAKVEVPPEMPVSSVLKEYIDELTQSRPLRSSDLESFLLRVNGLPGQRSTGVLDAMNHAEAGSMVLKLQPLSEQPQAVVAVNNHGSRFLGPWQTLASASASVAPLHRTTVTFSSSLPADEMNYAGIRHNWAAAPRWNVELFAGYVVSEPGHTLAVSDIESESVDAGLRFIYQPVRQRDKNWQIAMQFDGRDTDGDILGTPLTRDKIRTARLSSSYDWIDAWHAQTVLDITFSQGINGLGASDAGDANLSRAGAEPDFRKAEFSLVRQQYLGSAWLATAQLMGQYASDPLFSAEEFGYGGINIGRAYDPSEIIGDHGVAGSMVLTYTGLQVGYDVGIEPYVFYDVGRIWNEDAGSKPQSAASAGIGVKLIHANGLNADIALAQPLTKSVNDPLTGNDRNPRLLFEAKKSF